MFFFSSRRRHTRSLRDWSSDVCSSDLLRVDLLRRELGALDVGGAVERERTGLRLDDADLDVLCERTARHKSESAGDAEQFRSEERRVGNGWRARVTECGTITNVASTTL